MNKNRLFPKFRSIPILGFQVKRDYVCFTAPIYHCVELSLVYETICENCSNFALEWFQPNSFGEVWPLEKSMKICKKFKFWFWKFWECPLFDIREYACNQVSTYQSAGTSAWVITDPQCYVYLIVYWINLSCDNELLIIIQSIKCLCCLPQIRLV